MSQEFDVATLTEHLCALGVPEMEAEAAAKMQIEKGVSQYARFAFLYGAWSSVVREDDHEWIDHEMEQAEASPGEPGTGAGLALKRLLAAGADRGDLTELMRVMQWQMLHNILYQLADCDSVDYPLEEMPRARWALVEMDEENEITGELSQLHELVLLTEPSKREMRLKKDEQE